MAKAVRKALSPELETIEPGTLRSFRWCRHGYPHALAKWHCHPEYELHAILESAGKVFVGDYIGTFQPGNLILTGPGLPHNWISYSDGDKDYPQRDLLIQFHPDLLKRSIDIFPELREVRSLLAQSRRGIEFGLKTSARVTALLQEMEQASGAGLIRRLLEILEILQQADDARLLASEHYTPSFSLDSSPKVNRVMHFLFENFSRDIAMAEVASLVGMSDSVFSRFFKQNTGNSFVRYLNTLRINRAAELLHSTDLPVSNICFEVGFNNLSNFNRQFIQRQKVTPTAYRQRFLDTLQQL